MDSGRCETVVMEKDGGRARVNAIDCLLWESRGWKRVTRPNAPPSAPEPIVVSAPKPSPSFERPKSTK